MRAAGRETWTECRPPPCAAWRLGHASPRTRVSRPADAAEAYERAWACEGEASAPVGYKLAFNYLKAGRATAAIDVAKKVLAAFPDYPRIRSDVLDRARAMVRTAPA